MAITDFFFACAVDEVPAYFTYEKESMLVIQSKASAKLGKSDFENIEKFIPALISHESIHVVISRIENSQTSESLDNIKLSWRQGGEGFKLVSTTSYLRMINQALYFGDIVELGGSLWS